MKKPIAFILSLVMCLSLCACGGENNDNDSSHYSTKKREDTEKTFTYTDAQNTVRESIMGGLLYFRLKPYSASKIDNISIATLTGSDTDGGWIIECKGTFTAYDEYGDVLDRYKFEVSQKVNSDGTTDYADVNVTKK